MGGCIFERNAQTLENTPTPLFGESLKFIAHAWVYFREIMVCEWRSKTSHIFHARPNHRTNDCYAKQPIHNLLKTLV